MFIFHFVYTEHHVLLICNEKKEICVANLSFFPLKNTCVNILGSSF